MCLMLTLYHPDIIQAIVGYGKSRKSGFYHVHGEQELSVFRQQYLVNSLYYCDTPNMP